MAAALAAVPDPRRLAGWRPACPPLPVVGLLPRAVAALLCGARSLSAVAPWGRERVADDPAALVPLALPPGRGPGVATRHRAFQALDPAAFAAALGRWLAAPGIAPGEAIAVAGPPPARADARRRRALPRVRWGIENRPHRVRDVTFAEDRCAIRTGAARRRRQRRGGTADRRRPPLHGHPPRRRRRPQGDEMPLRFNRYPPPGVRNENLAAGNRPTRIRTNERFLDGGESGSVSSNPGGTGPIRPARVLISQAVLVPPGAENAPLWAVVAAIDRVHGTGALPAIPIIRRQPSDFVHANRQDRGTDRHLGESGCAPSRTRAIARDRPLPRSPGIGQTVSFATGTWTKLCSPSRLRRE